MSSIENMSPEAFARAIITGKDSRLLLTRPRRWGRKTWAEQVAKELERLGWTVHRITLPGKGIDSG